MTTFLDAPSTSSTFPMLSNLVPEDEQNREIREAFDSAMAVLADKPKLCNPSKGLCIKFRRFDSDQKAFINLCHTEEIPSPKELSEGELARILESDNFTAYRVPLSLGLPHDEQDKSGKPSMAYDVIINSKFFCKVAESELFRTFVILLAVQGVEDKYNIQLSRENYVILQNKKYWGTMPEHYIQNRGTAKPGPLIDEIETMPPPNSSLAKYSLASTAANVDPRVRLSRVQKPGRTAEHLVAEIKLADLHSVKDISLDLAKDRILLQKSASGEVELDLYLPLQLNVESARAQFDYKTRALRIDAPILCN
ncbi:PIH1 domain-containing protein 1-like [Varroa jacobsoni]|uniref:PIH1 domain-containing protein 1 n=1 Tax=Varroa destructor TaxID=109461 RepID=A0A7M7M8R3_VARDE|nr:PIH1 domain-containing protein 1-like [Varroa destructor]XP_022707112.1 PIH1 domain-containing protein 1-like [Varroa jacobsoni]XP_022707113.1 PIH1 domain-containing protein 1-like [Varroa jacobsoni]XP_022707114.1 PIH1 domain-containing protein 1-like [Varroa jacobsoni]XP_022707115.1 PIH1 domain-containing protein 1-like [Varroa jacobsoni]XP_022707116.1 PIH1 domain-containing protein 1-like [Varroa jacobsoni]